MRLYAHVLPCTPAETAGTFVVIGALSVVLLGSWRMMKRTMTERGKGRRQRLVLPLVLATVLTVAGCGGKSPEAVEARPTTDARVQILEPTPNQVTGPDLQLKLDLLGARVVEASKGELRPDEGHIHVTLDGKLISMTYGTTQDLRALAPGPHSLQAEFVAIDHVPFANRVLAAVLFRVGP